MITIANILTVIDFVSPSLVFKRLPKNQYEQDRSSQNKRSDRSDRSDRNTNPNQEYPPNCYRCEFKPETKQEYDDHCSNKHRGYSGYPNNASMEKYDLKHQGMDWEK